MRVARVRIFTADKNSSLECSFYDRGQDGISHIEREFHSPIETVLLFLQTIDPTKVYSIVERMNGSEVSQILIYYSVDDL